MKIIPRIPLSSLNHSKSLSPSRPLSAFSDLRPHSVVKSPSPSRPLSAFSDLRRHFVKNFKGHAQILEKGSYTLFTPHYITWYCPAAFVQSSQCKSQCINRGRYCAPDPEKDFGEGYQGKDVVYENLRQLCVHRVANESNWSWVWWDFVTDFHIRCFMKEKRYNKKCAEDVMKSLDLPIEKILKCMGDPEADVDNEVLKIEQELQIGRGSRGDVTILPTLVINNVQYRVHNIDNELEDSSQM